MVDKEVLDRIERLEEKANMKEQTVHEAIKEFRQAKEDLIRNIGKPFDVFIEKCEQAGVKFSKEEKQVEEWPKLGSIIYTKDINGNIYNFEWHKGMKDKMVFKTRESAEKYYSIIDTINEIVDELGRPSWDEMADNCIMLQGACYNFKAKCFHSTTSSIVYNSGSFFPLCKKPYLEKLLEKVSEKDLLWAFKKSMRLV